ncbi:MAG: ferrous iron transport protein A [Verrucomicrobia bacterium]|nr:ferrous iron transport protein A [Verrucomicrobiota bacterium]
MSGPISLSKLALGQQAVLRSFPPAGAAFLRLREMGLLPGTRLILVRQAPLGDPLEIEVRGYRLSLRRAEAECILVDPDSPS